MKRRPLEPQLDREVVELLKDEPELLALADAVSATAVQGRTSARRHWVSIAVAAALIGAALAVVVGLPSSPPVVERALAAVGTRPLLVARFERANQNDSLVDLATGAVTPSRVRVTAVADDATGVLRVRVRHNGALISDSVAAAGVPGDTVGVDETLAHFVRGYRRALRSGAADERRVKEATSLVVPSLGLTVALDNHASPRVITGARRWRVVAIGSRTDRRLLEPRNRPLAVTRGDVVARRPLTVDQARRSLAGHALVPRGTAVYAERLRSIRGTQSVLSVGVRLELSHVVVQEALAPEAAYGFAEGRLTFDSNPIPTGAVDLHGQPGDFIGQLKIGRVYVTLRSRSRQALLAVARALAR